MEISKEKMLDLVNIEVHLINSHQPSKPFNHLPALYNLHDSNLYLQTFCPSGCSSPLQ
ncbi:hypothetical protein ES705_14965 [subsurface metagenome]